MQLNVLSSIKKNQEKENQKDRSEFVITELNDYFQSIESPCNHQHLHHQQLAVYLSRKIYQYQFANRN